MLWVEKQKAVKRAQSSVDVVQGAPAAGHGLQKQPPRVEVKDIRNP